MLRRIFLPLMLAAMFAVPAQAEDVSKKWPPKGKGIILVDGIVAIVDTGPVTLFQLVRAAGPYIARLRQSATVASDVPAKLRKIYRDVLENLVNDMLIFARAKSKGVEVSKAQIDAQINQVKKVNNWTDAELIAALGQMGFQSMAEYRKHAKREIMKNQLIGREVSSRIKVDASEVQRVFSEKYGSGTNVEERRVGHVLIRLAELAPKAQVLAAEAKLKKLRADIVAGKDSFEEMARRHSQDTTAPAGGDIGWISRGDTDPDFEKTAFRIQKGVVSKPVRSSFGYHLVKVTEVRTKHVLTPDKKKSLLRQIRYRLREKQLMSLYKQWVKTLRADSFVEKKALLHELLGR